MRGVKAEFVLTKDTYREKDHSSVTELSRAMQNEGSWLSSVVTHMNYSSKDYGKQNFPMLMLTEGMGNVKKVKDFDYKFPVIGRPKKTSRVARNLYQAGDKPGVGRSKFVIPFEDKLFANQQTLVTKGDVQVRVQGEPEYKNGAYQYTVQLWNASETAFCALNLLAESVVWAGSVFKAPYEDSYGVESRSYLGGTATNMTSLVRNSYKLKGNVQNKIMMYTIKADGKTFTYYTDWEMFLADLAFKEQCEYDIWTSKYGRDSKGEFIMYDELTGVGIPSGAGIDPQIPNRDSHSALTYKKLSGYIRDITFNITDATANVEIWTGTGGMEDINNALKDDLKGFALIDSKQYSEGGNSYDMVYGSYFKAFRHQDGAMVTFRHHPMFDRGIRGDISDIHPISGLPKSSHDLYILDRSTYEGENNFQYVMEEGREYTQWSVMGSIVPKGFKASDSRASDRDSSSVHGMKSQGIQIMKPTGCLKSECI